MNVVEALDRAMSALSQRAADESPRAPYDSELPDRQAIGSLHLLKSVLVFDKEETHDDV